MKKIVCVLLIVMGAFSAHGQGLLLEGEAHLMASDANYVSWVMKKFLKKNQGYAKVDCTDPDLLAPKQASCLIRFIDQEVTVGK